MVFLFIVGLILGLLGIIGICLGDDYRIGGVVLAVVALVCCMGSTVRVVEPRSVGIEITLGKVTDAKSSGLHFVLPWSKVENYPSTIQTTRLEGGGDHQGQDGPCVTVRLGNQTTACVNVAAQWTVNTNDLESIQKLYTQWKSFGNLEPQLIRPRIQHALLDPFQTYDPMQVLKNGEQLVAPTAELEAKAKELLIKEVGNGIQIHSLTINLIGYDQTTQEKINAFSQAVADTRIAEQQRFTAEAKRQANEALASSSASSDEGVLLQNCLDTTERLTKEGKALPAGWTCFGGSSSPVVRVN